MNNRTERAVVDRLTPTNISKMDAVEVVETETHYIVKQHHQDQVVTLTAYYSDVNSRSGSTKDFVVTGIGTVTIPKIDEPLNSGAIPVLIKLKAEMVRKQKEVLVNLGE